MSEPKRSNFWVCYWLALILGQVGFMAFEVAQIETHLQRIAVALESHSKGQP